MIEEKTKRYRKISQNITQIFTSKKIVQERGSFTGFKTLEPYISFVKGATSTIFGTAGSGKTQVSIEFCISAAKAYGEKTVFYLTEAGDYAETVLDICQTHLRKRLEDITDEELLSALEWMDEFIYVIDISNSLLNIREIYEDVLSIQQEYDLKVDYLVIDHYHNLIPTPEQKGMTIADNVKYTFQAITRTSKKFGLHTMILFHTKDVDSIKCPQSGKHYLPKPEFWMLSGGMQSSYLSQQMISVWRPIFREEQYGIINPNTGVPFELNEMHITCMKVKPKNSGKIGGAVLHFDWAKQSYWEEYEGKRYYAGEYYGAATQPTSTIKPNYSFEVGEDIF